MSQIGNFLGSSIGKKLIMGLSGLFLCLFLLAHVLGNLTIFGGKEMFNAYTNAMHASGLVIPGDIILLIAFGLHIMSAIQLSRENRKARPQRYAVDKKAGPGKTFMSSHMFHTGMIILIFLVIHIIGFKFGGFDQSTADNTLYDLVTRRFSEPLYALGYVVAMIAIGMHLHHAIQSAFQTLGLNDKRYTPSIKATGVVFSLVVGLGFLSIPAYTFMVNNM